MQNKYKVNYRKDFKKAKIKKFISVICMFILIVVLLVFVIYSIYMKSKKTNSNNIIEDIGNNAGIEDEIDKNSKNDNNNNVDTDDESSLNNDNVSDETNIEIDEDEKTTDDKKEFIYGEKVPVNEEVADEYFDDAVFIGNSQIEGILIYSTMKNATIYASKGIMVDTIFTKEVVKTNDGARITIMDALAKEKFGKVYIMLGANELGWAFDYLFIEQYSKVIDEIKKLQPDAKIYVNAIMPVSKEKTNKDKIYNNKNIDNYNNLILNMTKEKEVYFLDSKEALADEEGNLPEDAGTDGVHFNATYYAQWFNYLKTHIVN